ncbi:MAG: serpin family protein, partial [Lachnospiraceae bacterium]|nr:serpin family protein [Lachnospiraceae bacterium]
GSYGSMIFILPDEGVSVYDLLSDKQVMEYLEKGYDYENKKGVILDIAIPRFDVSSDSDLSEGLKKLGVTDAFNRSKADFSPVSDESDGIWVNKVEHGVRVITDE